MGKEKILVIGAGGQLSNCAIICRELKKPAVTNLRQDEFEQITNDDELIVDGTKGIVQKI